MSKSFLILSFLALLLFVFGSCADNASTNQNLENKQDAQNVSVVLQIIKNDSGKVVEEYQMDSVRKIKHGYEKIYDNAGKLTSERNYKMGQAEGAEVFYHTNGQVKSQIVNNNNRRNGAFKHFYENGQLEQEGVYKDDGIEGVLNVYYQSGKPKETLNFKNGDANGSFVEYNENGSLKAKGSYISNANGEELEQGLLELYNDKGELKSKMNCETGVCRTIWTVEKGDITPQKLNK